MIINLSKFIDKYVGFFICLILGLFSRKIKKSDDAIEKILIVKLWALGDSIISLVLIKALRQKYPNAIIDVLVRERNKLVYYNNKDINKIIYLPDVFSKIKSYDVVFDTEPYLNVSSIISYFVGKYRIGFSHAMRSNLYNQTVDFNIEQHMVENYLDMFRIIGGKYNTKTLVPLQSTEKEKNKVKTFFNKNKITKLVGLTITTAETAKDQRSWSIEKYEKIANYFHEKKFNIIIVAGPNEKKYVEEFREKLNFKSYASYDHFSLLEVFYLIKKCEYFVSNDTGPMHIAAAQGVKTIGIFGANTPTLWGPYGTNCNSVYIKEDCSPCINNKKGTIEKCNKNSNCLKIITVNHVIKAIEKLK